MVNFLMEFLCLFQGYLQEKSLPGAVFPRSRQEPSLLGVSGMWLECTWKSKDLLFVICQNFLIVLFTRGVYTSQQPYSL